MHAPIKFSLLVLVAGCETLALAQVSPLATNPGPPPVIYTEGGGLYALHIRGERHWSGNPDYLYTTPLSTASANVRYWRTTDATCVEGAGTFGAPDTLSLGVEFQCGTARFKVVDCDEPETCRYARIEAILQTGVAPDYQSLREYYWYNRCRGVESMTLESPTNVGFGATLELRQGPGLLAQPDSPACTSDPSSALYNAAAQPASIYTESDGQHAWHVRDNRFWSGDPRQLGSRPLSQSLASVTYSRAENAVCVDLSGMIFGAPDRLSIGTQFRCGTARFEIVDCEDPEACFYVRIEGLWQTGIAPNYRSVPVTYWYNRCRGVESITFSPARPLRVSFGETLELRQGLGLLAQPNSPTCRNDHRSALYE